MLKVIIKGSFLLIFFLLISCEKENDTLCKDKFVNVVQKTINNKYNKVKDIDYKIKEFDSNTCIIFYKSEIYCIKYVNNKFVCLYILDKNLLPTYCIRINDNYLTLYKIIYNKNNVIIKESTKRINKSMLNLRFCDFLFQYKAYTKNSEFETIVLTLPDLFLKHPLWKEINL